MPPLLQLHLLVFLITSTGILGRLIELPPEGIVAWRTLIASTGALAIAGVIRRLPLWPGKRRLVTMLGVGAIMGLHWICFFAAIKLANVSICLAGLATISLFTAFSEPLLTRKRIRPYEVLLGLLVLAGIVMIAGSSRGYLAGLAAALAAAVLASIFPVLNRDLVQRGCDPQVMVGWEMIGAFLVTLPVIGVRLFKGYDGLLPAASDWGWLLILGLVCTVFGHAFHIHLLKRITAYQGNLAFNFEPVYGIVAAGLIFGEWHDLHPGFYFGAATVIAANLLHPWLERRLRMSLETTD
ncbi:DMT family transporter [Haloferula sargassicola]|uniref:EamA domain-containing protein n=1 Tax=Haloferula sargassicola TaxID=490096 RepID=A0ABP9UTD9_9BACT